MKVFIFAVIILTEPMSWTCLEKEFQMKPSIENDDEVSYFLFSRRNMLEPTVLDLSANDLDLKAPVKVLIHGFTEHAGVQWYKEAIKAYLEKGDYNIIAVDWSKKANGMYPQAVQAARSVGRSIGNFFAELHEAKKLELEDAHLIGHSLGSHVAGFAGKQVYRVRQRKIGRITGLDPAGPLFDVPFLGPDSRLHREDAQFVDIVHTDAGILGFRGAMGHADFFPNGGSAVQPGCEIKSFNNLTEYFCSHYRSHQYFVASISTKLFAKPCPSWILYNMGICNSNASVPFGESASSISTGDFYLRINFHPPYSS